MSSHNYIEIDQNFFVEQHYVQPLKDAGLSNFDSVFLYEQGQSLNKVNIKDYRKRICFQLPGLTLKYFLKRYEEVPKSIQIRSWLNHGMKASFADYDRLPVQDFTKSNIHTYNVIAYGSEWDGLFEKRSFVIIEEIPSAEAIERRLPTFITHCDSGSAFKAKKEFIRQLALFTKRFHDTGYRHRDYYFSHIFYSEKEQFYLIDLHRAFKPKLLSKRYRLKDLCQLYYSAPGDKFTRSDRLRFYYAYTGKNTVSLKDRLFIKRLKNKAWRMADHDIKHGRPVPFAS